MTFAHLPAVVAEVEPFARAFSEAGKRLYLVGGIVRDLWLNRELTLDSDIDLTTDAHPVEIKRIVSNLADSVWTQGERFGTIGCSLAGRDFEITTHRAEVYVPESRKPEVAFGDDIAADLLRRDFTVNAMAYEVPEGKLIDPHGGCDDLSSARLRTPLSPTISFGDDPLRMIRAARFANAYHLVPDADLLDAARSLRDRLDIVAIERVRAELEKFLSAPEVNRGFALLTETDLLTKILPGATEHSVALACAVPPPWWLRVSALIAPLASDRSAIRDLVNTLRCSRETRLAIEYTVMSAHDLAPNQQLDDEVVRRWVHQARGHASSAWILATAMWGAEAVEPFGERWLNLASAEDLDDETPPLTGVEIGEMLNVAPGPDIGRAVEVLSEYRMVHGPIGAGTARDVLRSWWAGSDH